MKKFYTTLGMLSAFAAASAINVADIQMEPQGFGKMQSAEKIAVNKPMKAPAKAATLDDVLGNYMWIGYSALESGTGYEQGDLQLVKDGDDVIAYGMNILSNVKIKATVDAAKGTVSFPAKVLVVPAGEGGAPGDIYFEHMHWNDAGDNILSVDTPLVLNITEEGGLVCQDDLDLFALTLYIGGEMQGFYRLYYMNEFVKRPATLSNDGWVDDGTATISQDWFSGCPYFELDKKTYDVKVQRNVEDKNIIRLLNPYGEGTPYAPYNVSAAEGAIVLDLTYPNCVVVRGATEELLGYTQSGDEVTCIMGNWAGFMQADQASYPDNDTDTYIILGFTQEDVLGEVPADELSTYDEESKTIMIKDAIFSTSFSISQSKYYNGWTETGQMGVPTIKLNGGSGVESVEFDSNAPVRYYNLQGVEIENPENGQLVIKRQGAKSQKVFVK